MPIAKLRHKYAPTTEHPPFTLGMGAPGPVTRCANCGVYRVEVNGDIVRSDGTRSRFFMFANVADFAASRRSPGWHAFVSSFRAPCNPDLRVK